MNSENNGKIIIEMPQHRSGVYIILNPVKKKAYVGESMDMYFRWVTHIRGIFLKETGSNKNLTNETCQTFEIFPALTVTDGYKKEKKAIVMIGLFMKRFTCICFAHMVFNYIMEVINLMTTLTGARIKIM